LYWVAYIHCMCKAYLFPVESVSGGKNLILNFMSR
jgi:hypothetical protein